MRILCFTQRIGKRTINFIHNEILYLQERHEVLVLSHFISEENPIVCKRLKYIRHYENNKVGRLKKILNQIGFSVPSFEKDFKKHVDDFKPDVIHVHFGNIACRVLHYFQNSTIPIFVSFHGYDASQKLKEEAYRKALNELFKRPNIHPIFASQFMYDYVRKAGVDPSSKNILYYGTDVSRFNRKGYHHKKEPFIFLQISSFAEKKGHRVTLKAFKLFLEKNPHANVKLVFGGGGEGMKKIQNLCNELNLNDYVDFKNWVTVEQTINLMEHAHAFLHHSIVSSDNDMEGIPNAIMEAMAMELPVISSYHSGIPELIEDGVNGYLVEEYDVENYAIRLKDILEWRYLKINREKILSTFEKEKHGQNLVGFYQQVLKGDM